MCIIRAFPLEIASIFTGPVFHFYRSLEYLNPLMRRSSRGSTSSLRRDEWAPKDMEDEVFRYVTKPHLHRLHDRISHLMTVMRYYDLKYTYTTCNHLQYLHKYLVTYHCFKLWCNLSRLRTLKNISRMKN